MSKPWQSILTAFAIAAALVSPAGYAQAATHAADLTAAEVRKVDKENKKVTLKHDQIKNLDMPPMTMVFNVNDPAMLDKLKPGDKVQFRAADEGGKLTVTEIQAVK
jgi:Cu(I)/Ag(I) efflux system protein CusF